MPIFDSCLGSDWQLLSLEGKESTKALSFPARPHLGPGQEEVQSALSGEVITGFSPPEQLAFSLLVSRGQSVTMVTIDVLKKCLF